MPRGASGAPPFWVSPRSCSEPPLCTSWPVASSVPGNRPAPDRLVAGLIALVVRDAPVRKRASVRAISHDHAQTISSAGSRGSPRKPTRNPGGALPVTMSTNLGWPSEPEPGPEHRRLGWLARMLGVSRETGNSVDEAEVPAGPATDQPAPARAALTTTDTNADPSADSSAAPNL